MKTLRRTTAMDDDWLEDQFPLGDGTAETAAWVICPYCGADVEIALDPGGGAEQHYVEDCEVCCHPWNLTVRWDQNGTAQAEARTEEDV